MLMLRRLNRASTHAHGRSHQRLLAREAQKKKFASVEPWQARDNIEVQRVTQKAMVYTLVSESTRTIESTLPWFLENMPESYFMQVPEQYRMDHIKAIAAVKDANMDLYLNLKAHTPDGRTIYTFIRPGTKSGTLLKMVEELPKASALNNLSQLHVFSTKDGTMSLNMFVYGEKQEAHRKTSDVVSAGQTILDTAAAIRSGKVAEDGFEADSPLLEPDFLVRYMERCPANYIEELSKIDARRFLRHLRLFRRVSGTEGMNTHIEKADAVAGPNARQHYWVDVAVANSLPQVALEHMCRLLFLHDFDVTRARLDVVSDDDNGSVTILRMFAAPTTGRESTEENLRAMARELKRSKWLDPATMDLVFDTYPWLGVWRGEVITALCALMHPIMAKENRFVYSRGHIYDMVTMERNIRTAAAIADLFLARFNPAGPMGDAEFGAACRTIQESIASDVEDTMASALLNKMITIVSHTLKTNIYMPHRYALSLRLDPKVMAAKGEDRDLPYGVFFVHGRRFNSFHVRFRDISRGGMRLVTPSSPEQYALESARQYDECYGLAYAQQLKNKDIPEGGSKAVNLINVTGLSPVDKSFIMRKCVKAFTDSILDLVVDTEETRSTIVDRLGKKEVLYLGPDEQVIPEDINWIIRRAEYRGYPTPAAFMSSKPRAGINHKEYGVTSEGLNVYLDVALRRALGIDPTKEPFTIKMTGGPDGDVAGNEIRILIREYGDNVRIIGIADGTGCAEDPGGLDHGELLRLVDEGHTISHFERARLGPEGVLHLCDHAEGIKARNTMHNRLEADAFVPCGGRPNTIDITNYAQFIKPDGAPSSRLIVEGANLFITAEARRALFEKAGVIIVKDSSANKGGVITSSYEICAAMLLSEEEFFQHKEQIVGEVLAKLRGLAKLEAELLFREFENYIGSLPEVSAKISNSINAATDALTKQLENMPEADLHELLPLFRAHLPKTIADLSFDDVHARVPAQYIKNAISSCLASKIVYKEGTKFIEVQPKKNLASIARKYISKDKEIAALVESLSRTAMPDAERQEIIALLEAGGTRTALRVF